MKQRKYLKLLLLFLIFSLPFLLLNAQKIKSEYLKNKEVLGAYNVPKIYLSSDGYSSGGVISLASTDEPAVNIQDSELKGTAEISVYEANREILMDYLIHDKDGKQLNKKPNTQNLKLIGTVKRNISSSPQNESTKVPLPIKGKGIWALKIKLQNIEAFAFVVRSGFGTLLKQGDDEYIFWTQDFKSKRSVDHGDVDLFSLENGKQQLSETNIGKDGIAKLPLNEKADIAVVNIDDDVAIVPVNLKYLNYGGSWIYFSSVKANKILAFTDRPLYKPGDEVFFKAIIREDDDGRYSIPKGDANVRIYSGWENENPVYEKRIRISDSGTLDGKFRLSKKSETGYYRLVIDLPGKANSKDYYPESTTFNVEFYKKPDADVNITIDKNEVISGDTVKFKVKGNYFSGHPLANQKVKYVVSRHDYYEYQYASTLKTLKKEDAEYGYGSSGTNFKEGNVTLDKKGEAEISFNTKGFNGKNQLISIMATLANGSNSPTTTWKNVLAYSGEFGIYRTDYAYTSKTNEEVSIPIELIGNKEKVNLEGINLSVGIERENWISYQTRDQKYPSYRLEKENLGSVPIKSTNKNGFTSIKFTPVKEGFYKINVQAGDSRRNSIIKTFHAYVTSEELPYLKGDENSELTVRTDKESYEPNETAKLTIYSNLPNRDVFLSLERGRTDRYQIVRLSGKKGLLNLPFNASDIPNIYTKAYSFSDSILDSGNTNIKVSPEGKKIKIELNPNSIKYGPSQTVKVDIKTTDNKNNPISADVSISAVDAALFKLDGSHIPNVFDYFWRERWNSAQDANSLEGIIVSLGGGGGGCFAKGTKVLMADSSLRNIEQVKKNDFILTFDNNRKPQKAKVLSTHSALENGLLIINGNIKVTANHLLSVNGRWIQAGSIKPGDKLLNKSLKEIPVNSIEWRLGKEIVYNLEVEKFHTYFAEGILAHNQKGGVREIFKDTAYWNPAIKTDANGKAQISFKLPDNLTTWTISAIASTPETQVGEAYKDIKVSKDIVVLPILPNILRKDDDLTLTAMVQNFSEKDGNFNVDLRFDSGKVTDNIRKKVAIKSGEIKEINWKIKPGKVNEKAKLQFFAEDPDKKLNDSLIERIPVRGFNFKEKEGQSGIGNVTFSVKPKPYADSNKSFIELNLDSSLVKSVSPSFAYLIDYPYGCVEQTTSRFVPAVLAKNNIELFGPNIKGKNLDEIIEKSLSRLLTLQHGDGGWNWWFEGESNFFVSAYVSEYVVAAKKSGAEVSNRLFNEAKEFMSRTDEMRSKPLSDEEKVSRNYGLMVFDIKNKMKEVSLDKLEPDILAMQVMVNYFSGNKDPDKNGLNKLISLKKQLGNSYYWESGSNLRFGSKETSTALAIRAIILTGGDMEVINRAVAFLVKNKKGQYWANTFATSQTIKALSEFVKINKELNPDFTYYVSLDGKKISEGKVSAGSEPNKIRIPVSKIKKTGSKISVVKNGQGELYSTLLMENSIDSKTAPAVDHGLAVEKTFISENGSTDFKVGDIVNVVITVSGLAIPASYGIIEDNLPAGLAPINTAFRNETPNNEDYYSYGITDREITENGVILSLFRVGAGTNTYSYKARVVNEGTFIVPPANVSLMYSPEIYGRSKLDVLGIGTPKPVVEKVKKIIVKNNFWAGSGIVFAFLVIIVILRNRIISFIRKGVGKNSGQKEKETTQQSPPPATP